MTPRIARGAVPPGCRVTMLLLLVLTGGCGGQPKVVPVEGVVKLGGKPAANILVQFLPDTRKGGSGPTSTGTTDEQGRFRLKAQDGRDGAVPGTHMVVLVDLDEERPPQGQPMKKPPRLDPRYAAPTASNLTAEVVEGGGPITLEVPGRP
jgi:hypothetical protein